MRKLLTLEKMAAFFFLIFLIFTPLLYKIQLQAGLYQEGIYVEPLISFLGFSLLIFLWSFWKNGRKYFSERVREFFFPHPIAKVFYLLLAVLLLSWVYGVFLTGSLALGDGLRLVKYALYFSIFPLAIQTGKVLGAHWTKGILTALFAVGVATAAVSLVRIYQFVAAGNLIDFWEYSPQSRSVGFLGQYWDPISGQVGQILKAAHATFGLYLSVVLGMGLALFAQVRRVLFRIPILAGIGVIFAALLFTLSRGAVATGGLVILFGIVWLVRQKRFWAILVLTTFLFLETAVLVRLNSEIYQKFVSTFSGSQPVVTRLFEATSAVGEEVLRLWQGLWPSPLGGGSVEIPSLGVSRGETTLPPSFDAILDKSLSDRVLAWGEVWTLLNSRPLFFFLGVGYSIDNLRHFTSGEVVYPHSLFLDLWARGGLSAVILVSIVWLLLFAKVLQFWFSKEGLVAALGTSLLGFLTGWFLDNAISGEQFFSDAPMLAFWGTLGLVTALANRKQITATGKKKVLIALTSTEVGGAPQVVYDLLSQIPRQKVGFEFVVVGPAGMFQKKFQDSGYKVYVAPLGRISIRGFVRLFKVVREEQIDLISSHGKGAGLYSRLVGAALGVPVVHTFHGIHYFRYGRIMRRVYFAFERLMSQFTRLIINVSASQQREGVALKLFPRNKVRLVENGVDAAKIKSSGSKIKNEKVRKSLGLASRDFVAVVLARFDPIKGHVRLVEALPVILAKVPQLKVVLVGDGEEEEKVKRLAKDLSVSQAVVFSGQRDNPLPILRAANILLQPSYHEGLPLAPLEAAAAGVPVVAARAVGNVDTVLDGKTGYVVDFGEPAELARALDRLSRSASLCRRMGERGRQFVDKNFSMEKFVEKTIDVYKEALSLQINS